MRRTLWTCFGLCLILVLAFDVWLPQRLVVASGTTAQLSGAPIYYVPDARFDILGLVDNNRAQISSSTLGDGALRNVWDGRRDSGFVAANNPGWVQVSFNDTRTMRRFRTYFDRYFIEYTDCNTAYVEWSVVDGAGQVIVPQQRACLRQWSEYVLPAPVTGSIFRLNFRVTGGNMPALHEWELFGEAAIDSFSIGPAAAHVPMVVGDTRQFTALGRNNALNENYDVARSVNWSVTNNVGYFNKEFLTATGAGNGTVRGTIGTLQSTNTIPVRVKGRNLDSDIDVLLIERTPRLPFDPNDMTYSSGWPSPNQTVTYKAHVKNWGTQPVTVPYRWAFDGIAPGRLSNITINPGQTVQLDYRWTWPADGRTLAHTLEFQADPNNSLTEASKLNNRVSIKTNAMLLGLWVEQSVYNYFHEYQLLLNDGANGFEDWAQRWVKRWNDEFAKAVYPVSPNGILDRVALDKIVIVPDRALPIRGHGIAGNHPDPTDLTVDMQWGHPWDDDLVLPWADPQRGFFRFGWNGPFHTELAEIHELYHARFIVDHYALDVSQGNVNILDDNGQRVAGNPLYMPLFGDIVHINKYADRMGTGPAMNEQYAANGWNWKAFKRGRGNENGPPDFGVYTQDLPDFNHVQFVDQNGIPIRNVPVDIFQRSEQIINNTPDASYVTDNYGYIYLPRNPFGGPVNTYSNGTMVFRMRHPGLSSNEAPPQPQLYFMFQEVSDFNIEFTRNRGPVNAVGNYRHEIDLRDKPVTVPGNNTWLGNYFNGTNLDSFVTHRYDPTTPGGGFSFTWDNSPAPGVEKDDFSIYWQRNVEFADGWQTFNITADGGFQLYIDGRLMFDQWNNVGLRTWRPTLYTTSYSSMANPGSGRLPDRTHRVEVRYRSYTGRAQVSLSWQDEVLPTNDVPINAWRADYFSKPYLYGHMLRRIEARIDNQYGSDHTNGGGGPDWSMRTDDWSARWVGDFDFQGGVYDFTAIMDDGMNVTIDNNILMEEWSVRSGPATITRSTTINPGRHRLMVEYFDSSGNHSNATAKFGWVRRADH